MGGKSKPMLNEYGQGKSEERCSFWHRTPIVRPVISRFAFRTVTLLGVILLLSPACINRRKKAEPRWSDLFHAQGIPQGWSVRAWNDLRKPGPTNSSWRVKDKILQSEGERGNWLVSAREYGDFELEFDFKLGPTGNSGLALRAPMRGDPAFDGLELQMADFRYNPEAKDSELTGGIYRAIAPSKQVYRPTDWNHYHVRLIGDHLWAQLNGTVIHDLNLSDHSEPVSRHDGSSAPPVKDRPKQGHIGFQELSRGETHVQIRNARIRVLE
jgi:hypothetical protein